MLFASNDMTAGSDRRAVAPVLASSARLQGVPKQPISGNAPGGGGVFAVAVSFSGPLLSSKTVDGGMVGVIVIKVQSSSTE